MLLEISILGIFYVVAMVFLAIFKRCRKFALWTGLVAVIVTLTLMAVIGSQLRAEAEAAGYDSVDDQRNAQRAGITDPVIWHAQRDAYLKTWAAEAKQKEAAVKAAKSQDSTQADAACRTDFNCWSNKFSRAATRACAPLVERAAKNNFEWTDSFSSPKFPRGDKRRWRVDYLRRGCHQDAERFWSLDHNDLRMRLCHHKWYCARGKSKSRTTLTN